LLLKAEKAPLIHGRASIRATKSVNHNVPEMGRFLRVASLVSRCSMPFLRAGAAEDVIEGGGILLAIGELDAVVGQERMYPTWNRVQKIAKQLSRLAPSGASRQSKIGELRRAVDGIEEGLTAFGGPIYSQIDVEIPDRIALEALSRGFVFARSGRCEIP
jgi:hypothetical protein